MPATPFENMTLFCKPEQSGKTFLMIQQLIKDHTVDEDGVQTVHFIFCDNNLLLTKQTSQRIAEDLEQYVVDGTTYVEFSSRKDNVCRHRSVVSEAIAFENVRHIVCCMNTQRVSDVCKIVKKIAMSKQASSYRFKIWVDEADKALTHITKKFYPLCQEYDAVQLNCLTATPEALFKKFRRINVWALEETTLPDYHGWEDNDLVVMPEPEDRRISCFVRKVLDDNTDTPKNGQFWYIPAERKKTTHDEVRETCVSRGFAVFTVNGDGLRLSRPHPHKDITWDKDKLLNTQILEMCVKYGVRDEYPIAITGNICIGRGISIMSEPGPGSQNSGDPDGLFLDYGIVTHYGQKAADISQSAGRMKGNIKGWENYRKPTVFTTAKANKIAIYWESKSRRLAQLAFERGEGEVAAVTKTQFKTMGDDFDYIKHPVLFATMAEVRGFLKQPDIWKGMRLERAPSPTGNWTKTAREKCEGYAVSSKLHKLDVQTADLRLTIETAAAVGEGTSISSKKGSRFLILPVYETLDTPPDQEKYELRYLKFKTKTQKITN